MLLHHFQSCLNNLNLFWNKLYILKALNWYNLPIINIELVGSVLLNKSSIIL